MSKQVQAQSTRKFEAHISPCFKTLEAKLVWLLPHKFSMVGNFTVNEGGITLQALHPYDTMYIELRFSKDFFQNLSGSAVFQLDLGDRRGIPRNSMLSEQCNEIVWLQDVRSVYQFVYQLKCKDHQPTLSVKPIKLYDFVEQVKNVDACFRKEVEFCISTKWLYEALKNLEDLDRKGGVEFVSNSLSNSLTTTYIDKDQVSASMDKWKPANGEYIQFFGKAKVRSEYSWFDILEFLASVRSFFPTMTVSYSNNGPLQLESRFGKGIDLVELRAVFSPWRSSFQGRILEEEWAAFDRC